MQNTINNTAANNTANNAAANNAKPKEFLAANILNHLSEDEIQNILKMKNDEVINLKKDGTVFFKYRLTLDENGKKLGTCYDSFELKINNDLLYHFCLFGLKQKLKDILAIEKTSKNKDGKIVYNNYTESQMKELAKNRLENFAAAFENGLWTVRTEKLNTTIENAKNKVIYYNILNLRFNNFDKQTALLLNKQNENLVSEVYDLNENDFKLKCKEYNVE